MSRSSSAAVAAQRKPKAKLFADPARYYLSFEEAQGGSVPIDVRGTRDEAVNHFAWITKRPQAAKCRPFIPQATALRYRVVESDWLPGYPSHHQLTKEFARPHEGMIKSY